MHETAGTIRFAKKYSVPVWVVNSKNTPRFRIKSKRIFPLWDRDNDGLSDVAVPLLPSMWAEPTADGHICIIDPFKKRSYEFSCFKYTENAQPECTTFNIWDIAGTGAADPSITGKGGRQGAAGDRVSRLSPACCAPKK